MQAINTTMSTHTILWADDDPDDRELFKEVLSSLPVTTQIQEFPNGRELINFLKKSDLKPLPCLIVLDMNMPVLDGKETLAILKSEERFHSIPLVMFTTSNNELDRKFCDRFHIEMLTKPVSFEKVRPLMSHLLDICTNH
ncbi:MAG: response regulator [Flavisolibacter sp.]